MASVNFNNRWRRKLICGHHGGAFLKWVDKNIYFIYIFVYLEGRRRVAPAAALHI